MKSKITTSILWQTSKRCFSSGSLTIKPESLKLPYVLMNQKSLGQTKTGSNTKMLETIRNFVMNDRELNLSQGFKFAYETLVKSLADQDYDIVSQACEGNLSKAFALGLDTLREKKLKLNLLNERNHTWHMEVLDFHNYLGVEIDRKANRAKGIKEFAPFMMDLPNMTMYMPSNPMQAMASIFKQKTKGGPMIVDGLTMEILVKVRTNYKLDLVDPSASSSLIPS